MRAKRTWVVCFSMSGNDPIPDVGPIRPWDRRVPSLRRSQPCIERATLDVGAGGLAMTVVLGSTIMQGEGKADGVRPGCAYVPGPLTANLVIAKAHCSPSVFEHAL